MKGHFSRWQELYSRKTQVMRDVLTAVKSNRSVPEGVAVDMTSERGREEVRLDERVSRETQVNDYVQERLDFFKKEMDHLSRVGREVELLSLGD